MDKHIEAYSKTLKFLVDELAGLGTLWSFSPDDYDDESYLSSIDGLSALDALDSVAVIKYFSRRVHNPHRVFTDIATNIILEFGFNDQTVQALIVWNFIVVRIPDHVTNYSHRPTDLNAMLEHFIHHGDIVADGPF